jgi:hemolysin activation/secretion protein
MKPDVGSQFALTPGQGSHSPEMPLSRMRCVSCILAMMLSSMAVAQSPPDAGALLREQQRQQRRLPETQIDSRPSGQSILPVPDPNAAIVTIRQIEFDGVEGLAEEAALQAVVQPALGKTVDFKGLQHVANWVTQYLREQGYVLVQAYLPQQDVTDGLITIVVLQGRLDGKPGDIITVHGDKLRIAEKRLEAMAVGTLTPDETICQKDLERALLLMNDLPGISAGSTLAPGDTPGSTRLNVNVTEGPWLNGNLWTDNFGSRYTGLWRANALVNLNDLWGWGDQSRGFATVSEDYLAGTVGYGLPLGYHGLRLSADVTTLSYEIGKQLSDACLEGEATIVPVRLVYPLVRGRRTNLHATVGYDWKALEDAAAGTVYRDRRVQNTLLALSGDWRDRLAGGGYTDMYLGLVSGDLDLSCVATDEATDQAGPNAEGCFTRINYKISRVQNLPGAFSFYAALQGQWANENLNSSEEFSLGGPYGIRAYPVNEGRGDQGYLTTLELRYSMPEATRLGHLQFSAFYDAGRVRLNHDNYAGGVNTATGRNEYSLSGIGLGASLIQAGRYHLSAIWATTLGSNPGRDVNGLNTDGRDDEHQCWLQGIFFF